MLLRFKLPALLFSVIFLVISYHPAAAVQADINGTQNGRPISEFLDDEGNFQNPEGYSGSIDISGYSMQKDENGIPVFMNSSDNDNWTLETTYPGVNNSVRAMAVYGDNLFVGGNFRIAGGAEVRGVARYNMSSRTWYALDDIENQSIHTVSALEIIGDDLFLAGNISFVGGVDVNHIARYNITDETWHGLGAGLNNSALSLLADGTDLYVGGYFTTAGGISSSLVAKYDSNAETWHSLGGGVTKSGTFDQVAALAISGDDLFVGGQFSEAGAKNTNNIARYNLTAGTWNVLGNGVNNDVHAIEIDDNLVYVGGQFTEAGSLVSNNIARFNLSEGSWEAINSEINSTVFDIKHYENDFYIGTGSTSSGERIFRYNKVDDTWELLGDKGEGAVRTIVFKDEKLFVGGNFSGEGGTGAMNIAKYDLGLRDWRALGNGVNDEVASIAILNDQLFLGGRFSGAGSISANKIIQFDLLTQEWRSIGDISMNQVSPRPPEVRSIIVMNENLFVGGLFDQAEGVAAKNIARYNMTSESWHSLGNGVNSHVFAMSASENDLFAAGAFTNADGISVNKIARYNMQDETWHSLGDGLYKPGRRGSNFASVGALIVNGNNLYVGGDFTSAGGVSANDIARYDMSSESWYSISSGTNGSVSALAISGFYLYIGGNFSQAGGISANNIARYHLITDEWSDLENGLNNVVISLEANGDDLYAGGGFSQASGKVVNRIARYNVADDEWYPIGDGVNNLVMDFEIVGTDLFVGGQFTRAGSKPAMYFSRVSGLTAEQNYVSSIPGLNEGWHMMGAPVPNVTYSSLLNGIWTQGFSGAEYSGSTTNVLWYDESDRSTLWKTPADAANIIGSGQNSGFDNLGKGFLTYVFADDDFDSSPDPWPKDLSVTGTAPSGDVSLSLSRTTTPADGYEGWHLLANPYPFTIDWDLVYADQTASDINASIRVWDKNRSGGADYLVSGSGGDFDGKIAPFQGFWVQALNDGAAFTFKPEHEASSESTLFKQNEPRIITMKLEAGERHTWATILFDGQKAELPSQFNAVRMSSLTENYLYLYTESRDGEDTPLQIQYLPRSSDQPLQIPVRTASATAEQLRLLVSRMNLPEGVTASLLDTKTGERQSLNEAFTHDFRVEPDRSEKKAPISPIEKVAGNDFSPMVSASEDEDPRFWLEISYDGALPQSETLPQRFNLSQNYPNPFNPTTIIRYELPESSDVRLAIYDMAGREVATLVNETVQAGAHEVSFNASNLSSGVYMYRLDAGSNTFTRKLTLIK